MCIGRSTPSTPEPAKVDPTPTTVQPTDVQADTGAAERKAEEKRKRGRASTMLRSAAEETILGAAQKGRDTLG